MMHNAKTFVRALLARDKFTQIVQLCKIKSGKEYFKSFLHTTKLLVECTDYRFCTETDRKDIERHEGTLERENVKYLLGADSELVSLMSTNVPVFFAKVEYSFGSFVSDRDPTLHLEGQIQAFKAHQGQAVFVFLIGVVNHWVTVVVNKPSPGAVNELYLFDSSNPRILDKSEEELESISVENRCWSNIRLGLKPTIKFMVEMSI